MKVKIKKLHPEAIIPSYSRQGDAGMDLTAVDIHITEDYIEYKIGLAVEIPEGYMGLLFPRSSISKYDLILANSIGVVDSGYRNEICCRFKHLQYSENYKIYRRGERVAQLIILPFPTVEFEEVEELSNSERGLGGFGSTNK